MADAATRGANALSNSNFTLALSEYTRALIEAPTSPDYHIQRSIAFSRVKPPRHDLALKAAEYAVLCGQKRAKREKIQAGQQRRVVSLYNLGKYADAKFVLSTMERWRPADSKPAKMEGDMWNAKIDSKLQTLPEEQKVPIAKEYPDFVLPSADGLKTQLQAQLKADGSFKFPEDADASPLSAPQPSNGTSKEQTSSPSPVASVTKIRHEWYQNPQAVTLTLYAKGVAKDKAQIDIKADSVSISFPHPANPASTFDLSLDPLFALIDPSQSKATIMSTKVELILKKAAPGQKWHNLEGTEPLVKSENTTNSTSGADEAAKAAVLGYEPTSAEPEQAPSYPTSSRTGPKNWDKVANDLHAQSKSKQGKSNKSKSDSNKAEPSSDGEKSDEAMDVNDDDSDYGGDAVDGFFKKLYKGADDDTRRAMMKSFLESNGTALSTNWTDVGKGHVDEVKSKDD